MLAPVGVEPANTGISADGMASAFTFLACAVAASAAADFSVYNSSQPFARVDLPGGIDVADGPPCPPRAGGNDTAHR